MKRKMGRPRRDLSRRVFGILTVVSFAESSGKGSMFICKCACGRTKVVPGAALVKGAHKCCGFKCPLRTAYGIGHVAHQHREKYSPHVPVPEQEPWQWPGDEAALIAMTAAQENAK